MIFAVGMAVLFITSACVSWPVKLVTELGPLKIINGHVRPRLTWPSARLYRALATDLDGYAKESRKKLRRRARLYSASLIVTLLAVGGAALFWVDATF